MLLCCRFEKEIVTPGGVEGYRFTPPANVFDNPESNPDNMCYCPHGPPCAPSGLNNVSLCQFDSPVMLSFPHFYLGDDSLRQGVEGMSPADPEKHKFYLDIQPVLIYQYVIRIFIHTNLTNVLLLIGNGSSTFCQSTCPDQFSCNASHRYKTSGKFP